MNIYFHSVIDLGSPGVLEPSLVCHLISQDGGLCSSHNVHTQGKGKWNKNGNLIGFEAIP